MSLKNIITNLDASPVSYAPIFHQKTQYQTFFCGVVTAVLWVFIIFISVDKLISIVEKQEMYLSSVKER